LKLFKIKEEKNKKRKKNTRRIRRENYLKTG
jgi:hypothetical protein